MKKKKLWFGIFLVAVIVLVMLFFFLTTVSVSEPVSYSTTTSEQKDTINLQQFDIITLWVLNENNVWAYKDKAYETGKMYTTNELGKFLGDQQKRHGEKLFVYIKTSNKATYKSTVDVLDWITISGIKNYKLGNLITKEEKQAEKLN